jgi:hypothetical protein
MVTPEETRVCENIKEYINDTEKAKGDNGKIIKAKILLEYILTLEDFLVKQSRFREVVLRKINSFISLPMYYKICETCNRLIVLLEKIKERNDYVE